MAVLRMVIAGVILVAAMGCLGKPGEVVSDEGGPVADARESETPAPVADALETNMLGLFTYMADAALFEDCTSGQRYPVAMEAGYLELERAYLEDRAEPGAPLLVSFTGHLAKRPPMEGDGIIDMIVVDQFDTALPGEECGSIVR